MTSIYERNVQRLFRLCHAYMGGRAVAEDLVHETFIRLLEAEPRFENRAHEEAWLILTAKRLCLNELKRRELKNLPLDDFNEIPAPQTEEYSEVSDLIAKMPERFREVVYLYYFEGYDTALIAAVLRKNPSTVRNLLSDARKYLKQKIEEENNVY